MKLPNVNAVGKLFRDPSALVTCSGVLARQQSVRQSVQYRTERSRTGSLEDFTNSECTTIPDHAGGCVDPKTIEYPLKDSNLCF